MVYLILGLEAQTNIHYAMPSRSMLYDAMEYTRHIPWLGYNPAFGSL